MKNVVQELLLLNYKLKIKGREIMLELEQLKQTLVPYQKQIIEMGKSL